jgi:hypothetical protein
MSVPQTTLNGAINAAVTSVTVRDALGFASSAETDDLIQIDSEYLLVTAGLGTTGWTVTRAYAGSSAASHSDGATVTRLERGYTDASRLTTLAKADSVDYSYLQTCAAAANAWLNGEVGHFLGPSTDTVRTYDVEYGTNSVLGSGSSTYNNTLMIAGGLRTLTKAELRVNSNSSTWIDVTADALPRPLSWDRIDGLEADRILLTDYPTVGYRYWYPGYGVARVTGVFGPASPPNALRRIADTVGWWLYQSRSSGAQGMVGGPDTGEMVINRVLTGADLSTIDLYRGVGPSLYAMPAF